MKRRLWLALFCALAACTGGVVALARLQAAFVVEERAYAHPRARIRPDYADTVIPPNIAPLNFLVEEPGTHYRVTMRSTRGEPISIRSRSPKIVIPPKPWRKLLGTNRGETLAWDICVRERDGSWRRFDAIRNTIANEDIDGCLVYRLIKPLYNYWRDVGIYQRDLTCYGESLVVHGQAFSNGCVNCHSFCRHSARRMTVGIRGDRYGGAALLAHNGTVAKIGTKFGYTSWHPSGRVIAYSLNKVRQFFHASGIEVRDVVDMDSDLVYYDVGSEAVKTSAGISDPDRLETYPTWSPDGRQLYFCSAPILWSDRNTVPPDRYEDVRYDLMRIDYNVETDTWGKAETVLSSNDTGLSILLPRISPDGKFLLFCMCKYGCFPIYQPSSDLYLMDLKTGAYRRMAINSARSESWHSWSSNSRWFAFSSKRRDGLFTRTYLCYADDRGRAHKPVLLPQRDPSFYDSFLKTYTVPELIAEPVRVPPSDFAEAVRGSQKIEVKMPEISMTRKPRGMPDWRGALSERE